MDADCEVHEIPFVDVMTRFPVPLSATATNNPFGLLVGVPKATARQPIPGVGVVRNVQLIPSGEVMTELFEPSEMETATNNPLPYATASQP